MFDKFKEEKGGEMMEERIEENTNESRISRIISKYRIYHRNW